MDKINDILWGGIMLIVLFFIHLYFTVSCKFPQRHIFRAVKDSITDNGSDNKSAFTCLTINLASTIGVGNIVGVAISIVMGGPGAVFWCWITGVLGIATHYAESLLCLKYRQKDTDEKYFGGPMYVLKHIKKPYMAFIYALFASLCGLCIGSMVPANSIAETAQISFGIPVYASAAVIALFSGLVIIGGIKSIGNVCSRIMPAVMILYILAFTIIIIRNFDLIPSCIILILESAFDIHAGIGGLTGYGIGRAVRYGVSRSLFSNEAGMGSSGVTAAAMEPGVPAQQAMISATATFWDTVVLAGLTGFAFVLSIISDPATFDGLNGMELAIKIFDSLPSIVSYTMPIMLIVLGFSTIIGWCYIGEQAFDYIFKHPTLYRILWIISAFSGCILPLDVVWELCDILNIFMVIPNIIMLICLRKIPQNHIATLHNMRNNYSINHHQKNLPAMYKGRSDRC